jgi:hypothetical protein
MVTIRRLSLADPGTCRANSKNNLQLFILYIWSESIGAPIIHGRCPSLSAHERVSMLRMYLFCIEKQANGTWQKHSVYWQQRSYYLNVWVVTEAKQCHCAWEWVYASNVSRLQGETSKRHVGEAHSVLRAAILLAHRLSCYWGKIVSLRMLADLVWPLRNREPPARICLPSYKTEYNETVLETRHECLRRTIIHEVPSSNFAEKLIWSRLSHWFCCCGVD